MAPTEISLQNQTGALRAWAFVTVGLTVVSIFLLIAFGTEANRRINSIEDNWREYSLKASVVTAELARLQGIVGYGGLIHNYKHFVLRGDKQYEQLLTRDVGRLREKLSAIERLLTTDEDRYALATIRVTFEEYLERKRIAESLSLSGEPSDLDKIVRVDDAPALAGFDTLLAGTRVTAENMERRILESLSDATSYVRYGSWLAAFFVLSGGVTVVVLRQLTKTNARLAEARTRIDVLIDRSPDATLVVDRQGLIVRANEVAEKLFGYADDELLGQSVEQLVPPETSAVHAAYRSGYFDDPEFKPMSVRQPLFAQTKDGRRPVVEINLSYSGEGDELVAIAAIRDVTERHETMRLLSEAKEEATRTVEELKRTQDDLIESEKMASLGGLVAGVAHEINTPVGVTLTAATYLNQEARDTAAAYKAENLTSDGLETSLANAQEATKLIENNCRRAAELISSFKQVAVDQSSEAVRDFDLAKYLREIVNSLRPRFKHRKVRLEIDCPPDIAMSGLPGALSQVVTNLVVNAYTHAFGPDDIGRVLLRAEMGDDDTVIVACVDDGHGMTVEVREEAFEPFFTTKRNKGGTGLGMHIVANIVRNVFDGDIRIESTPGRGTSVIFTMARVMSPRTED